MLLLFCCFPFVPVDLRKEGVRFLGGLVHKGEIEMRCPRQGLPVDALATDDEDLFLVSPLQMMQGLCEGREDAAAFYGRTGMA